MFIDIVLLWMLYRLSAPAWCFVLVGIVTIVNLVKLGMDIKETLIKAG